MDTRHEIEEPPVMPDTLLTVETVDNGAGTVVVLMAGEIDQSTSEVFRGAVDGALNLPGSRRVEVDLSDVSFMDSSGLNALVGCRRTAEQRDRILTVVHPHEDVRRVLEISGLLPLFS